MEERFRRAQQDYRSTGSPDAAARYIGFLERMLGVVPTPRPRVDNHQPTFPCLICEKSISRINWGSAPQDDTRWVRVEDGLMASASRAVAVSTSGNYGSQVLDMSEVFFYICDECVIRNSNKMIHVDGGETENARDYYDRWYRDLKASSRHEDPDDSYMADISPYFD